MRRAEARYHESLVHLLRDATGFRADAAVGRQLSGVMVRLQEYQACGSSPASCPLHASHCAGPSFPYDYNANGYTWVGSYQTANISGWYNAQKHAHCYPGTSTSGTAGWFQWNIRDHSGAGRVAPDRARPCTQTSPALHAMLHMSIALGHLHTSMAFAAVL